MSCKNHTRHWFTRYGWVGSSAPTCRHCGEVNPKYDRSRDPLAERTGVEQRQELLSLDDSK